MEVYVGLALARQFVDWPQPICAGAQIRSEISILFVPQSSVDEILHHRSSVDLS